MSIQPDQEAARVYREYLYELSDAPRKASDPVAEAEEALKKLRANPNDKQAAEALEQATQQLKERAKLQQPANELRKN